MIPVPFPESNWALAASQEEYEPLPIYRFNGPEGRVAFCCRLSDAEIDEIVATRTLWVQQLTFGHRFQPIALTTQRPEGMR